MVAWWRKTVFTLPVGGLRIEFLASGLLAMGLTSALATSWVLFQGWHLANAVAIGLAAAGTHWLALLIHHFGHALAAARVGAPMAGIRLWGWLGTSLYPAGERHLSAAEHRRRAVGGPVASLALGILGLVLAVLLPASSRWQWLAILLTADSVLIFTVGALIPLGFNDGSTLLRYRPGGSREGTSTD